MRYIKANHGNELPSAFVCVDAETFDPTPNRGDPGDRSHHRMRCGHAIGFRRDKDRWTAERSLAFDVPAQFWAFVSTWTKGRAPVWVYAHNWSYDAQALQLWELIDAGLFQIDWESKKRKIGRPRTSKRPARYAGVLAIDDYPWWCVGRFAGGAVKLVDSMNYWRCKLERLAPHAGLDYVPLPNAGDDVAAWRRRCKRDCEILAVVMRNLMNAWRQEGHGNWQPTVSMLAYSSWRHTGMEHKVVTHESLEVKKLERSAYYGGECQQWFKGLYRQPVFEVDLQSAYPEIMATVPLPWKITDYLTGEHARELLPTKPGFTAIARVTIDSPWGECPQRTPDRTHYPIGRFETCLAGAELQRAWHNGEVAAVHECAVYRTALLFTRWVRQWQAKRRAAELAGDQAAADLAKLLPMALYGRLGLRPVTWVPCKHFVPPLRWGHFMAPHWTTGKPWKYRAIAGMCEMRNDETEREGSHISVPACVTAELRETMRKIRAYCPDHSILVQYADALWTTTAGLAALQASPFWGPGEYGKLKLKGAHAWLDVDAPNCFRSDRGEIACGVPVERQWDGPDGWKVRTASTTGDVIGRGPIGGPTWSTSKVPKWRESTPGVYSREGWR